MFSSPTCWSSAQHSNPQQYAHNQHSSIRTSDSTKKAYPNNNLSHYEQTYPQIIYTQQLGRKNKKHCKSRIWMNAATHLRQAFWQMSWARFSAQEVIKRLTCFAFYGGSTFSTIPVWNKTPPLFSQNFGGQIWRVKTQKIFITPRYFTGVVSANCPWTILTYDVLIITFLLIRKWIQLGPEIKNIRISQLKYTSYVYIGS